VIHRPGRFQARLTKLSRPPVHFQQGRPTPWCPTIWRPSNNIAPLYAADIDGGGQNIAIIGGFPRSTSPTSAPSATFFNLRTTTPCRSWVGDDPGYNEDVGGSQPGHRMGPTPSRAAPRSSTLRAKCIWGGANSRWISTWRPSMSPQLSRLRSLQTRRPSASWPSRPSPQGITWLSGHPAILGGAECGPVFARTPEADKGLSSFPGQHAGNHRPWGHPA